jgi:hypothetical protein
MAVAAGRFLPGSWPAAFEGAFHPSAAPDLIVSFILQPSEPTYGYGATAPSRAAGRRCSPGARTPVAERQCVFPVFT